MQKKTSTVTVTLRDVSLETLQCVDFGNTACSEVSITGKRDEVGGKALRVRIAAPRYQVDTRLRTLEDSVLCAQYLLQSHAITMSQKTELLKTAAKHLPLSVGVNESECAGVVAKMKTLPVVHETPDVFFRSSGEHIRFRLNVVFSQLQIAL